MALKRIKQNRAYGFGGSPLQVLAPVSVVTTRAPSTNDLAEIGQQWVDTSTDAVYVLTSVTAGSATWSTSPSSGATTLASLIVTTTSDLQGNVTVGGTLGVTGATTVVDLSISGSFNLSAATGQIDFSTSANQADAIVLDASAGGIDILASGASAGEDIDIVATGSSVNVSSTEDVADAIYLRANAGTSETVRIHSDQGTGAASVHLESDVGGITLTSGLASADAINLAAASGGIDVDGALQVNITSSQNAADAVRINASAGGIDVDAAGAAGEDINIANASGSIVLTAGESAVDSVKIESTAGGIDILASGAAAGEDIDIVATGSSVNISSSENVANAVVINASAGGIDITNTGTAGEDIDIASSGASVNISSTENVARAVYLHANAGTSETIQLHADQGTGVASVELLSDVGGITLLSGLAGDGVSATATSGSVVVTAGEAVIDAIQLTTTNAAGGVTVTTGALAATTGLHITQSAQTVAIQVGTGAPSHSAPKGSIYSRTDGSSTSTRLYVASDAAGTWVNVTTSA